ncbi:hypothetical protein AT959_06850 [Dechloromonas denitrificans]|uniref:Uncharacterized protein n=1 Tax=Dechloromonas denitrificans TaxID=281362 RepID=A0A133XKB1_9RHOO|nr:hypothetical protein AT959_06850 [Dechloromonas denitrificans]
MNVDRSDIVYSQVVLCANKATQQSKDVSEGEVTVSRGGGWQIQMKKSPALLISSFAAVYPVLNANTRHAGKAVFHPAP